MSELTLANLYNNKKNRKNNVQFLKLNGFYGTDFHIVIYCLLKKLKVHLSYISPSPHKPHLRTTYTFLLTQYIEIGHTSPQSPFKAI